MAELVRQETENGSRGKDVDLFQKALNQLNEVVTRQAIEIEKLNGQLLISNQIKEECEKKQEEE